MFKLDIKNVASGLDVVSVRGVEGMSSPFEFDIEVFSADTSLTERVGAEAVLWLRADGDAVRHGVIDRVTVLEADASLVRYRLHLVPSIAALRLRSNCRVFQDKTAAEVIATVLQEHGIDNFGDVTTSSRSRHPYLVQYRETDFEFVQRLVGDEGLFYSFEHDDDGHTMVIADDVSGYRDLSARATLTLDQSGLVPDSVSGFELSTARVADTVTLRDHDPLGPSGGLEATATVLGAGGMNEIYDYPGGFAELNEGKRRAEWRLEAERAVRPSAEAISRHPGLSPGTTFDLAQHAFPVANAGYVAVGVVHDHQTSVGAPTYQNVVSCMSGTEVYRSTRESPSLVMPGPQTATVVGPSGEEIYVDEHGRVKVQFHWDREGQFDENSSAWIRVVQPSSGDGWESIILPHVGQEVLVAFVDGDPNRPVIVGSLYNGAHPPPYALPEDKHKTGFRSRTKRGDRYHELMFDDAAGAEQVSLRSSKDVNVRAEDEVRLEVGRSSLVLRADGTITINGRIVKMDASDDMQLSAPSLPAGAHRVDIGVPIVNRDRRIAEPIRPRRGASVTRADLEPRLLDLEQRLDAAQGDAQLANLDLQSALQRQSQLTQTMSNINKTMHDTLAAIIQNLK